MRGCTGLEPLLPEVGPADPLPHGQQRRLAFAAAARFLANVAGSGRVVLVLDDLQWAGADAAELLGHLLRAGAGQVRAVIATRSGEVPSSGPLAAVVADLARINQVHQVRLEPLPRVDAEALVACLVGARPLASPRRARILRRAGGLPLFLIELTEAALHDEADEVPGNLRLAVAHQVAILPEPARLVLRRMAALGAAVEVERLVDLLVAMASRSTPWSTRWRPRAGTGSSTRRGPATGSGSRSSTSCCWRDSGRTGAGCGAVPHCGPRSHLLSPSCVTTLGQTPWGPVRKGSGRIRVGECGRRPRGLPRYSVRRRNRPANTIRTAPITTAAPPART